MTWADLSKDVIIIQILSLRKEKTILDGKMVFYVILIMITSATLRIEKNI